METALPGWLDAAFLAAALQGGDDPSEEPSQGPRVTVKGFHASLAVAAGDNYLSRLYRVKIEYTIGDQEKSTSLIVKAPFTKGVINEMGDEFDFYGKEPKVYNELFPILNKTINSEIGPKSFFSLVPKVLVLSDLKELGYEMCDRHQQLDFPHCEQVFKAIAKLHAASVLCKKDHPDLVELVGKEVYCNNSEKFKTEMKPWIQSSMKTVAATAEELGLDKDIANMVLNRVETAPDSMIRLCKPKESGLNVLNHGDLWLNNVLFKHSSSGDIVDVKFVDFQIMRYAMPALDLLYFIWTSANEDVRESQLPALCEIYTMTLNSTLERLGCEERLTEEELHEDFRDAVDWMIITVCNVLPVIVSERDNVINVEEIKQEDVKGGQQYESFVRLFKGKRFLALLPKLLEQLMAWESAYK